MSAHPLESGPSIQDASCPLPPPLSQRETEARSWEVPPLAAAEAKVGQFAVCGGGGGGEGGGGGKSEMRQ